MFYPLYVSKDFYMTPVRMPLIAYRSTSVTSDTAEALRLLEVNAAKRGDLRIQFKAQRESLAPSHLSLHPAGREVYLQGQASDAQRGLEILWGLAIPLGFTPWDRYPIATSPTADVFHFFGPWKPLFDYLCSEGMGEYAWASVCAAAQVDVGAWTGDRVLERYIQAQLHRVGLHCGPVDGVIGERTSQAIQALGYSTPRIEDLVTALTRFKNPTRFEGGFSNRVGHILLSGEDVSVTAYGDIQVVRTRQGALLTVDGPGKVILSVGSEV